MHNSKTINNSRANHKENHSREGVFICGKTHVDSHKTFASIFSAYTPSISTYNLYHRKQSDKIGIKWIVFEAIQNTRNSCFIERFMKILRLYGFVPCRKYQI